MRSDFVAHSAYVFVIVLGVGLMILEMVVHDAIMVTLICATLIGHVWLTRRAVHTLLKDERRDALATFIRAAAAVSRRTHPRYGPAPLSDPDPKRK